LAFTDNINVLDLLIDLIKEHEYKLGSLLEKMEIVEQTIRQDQRLNKTLKEYDSSTMKELASQCILVVDDDENLANTFKLLLESVGYMVDTAFNGEQALIKINCKIYDLILLDLNLPDMLGNEMTKEIKERCKQTDIVYITGYSMLKEEVEKRFENEEILMKPIEPDVLLETAARRICE
jgi:CheY-like chemotaxis protein